MLSLNTFSSLREEIVFTNSLITLQAIEAGFTSSGGAGLPVRTDRSSRLASGPLLSTDQGIRGPSGQLLASSHDHRGVRVQDAALSISTREGFLLVFGKIFMRCLSDDARESPQNDMTGRVFLATHTAFLGGSIFLPDLIGSAFGVRGWEGGHDELPLNTGKPPGLSGQFDNLPHACVKGVHVFRISKVLQVVDDLVNNHGGHDVDRLFSIGGRIRSFKRLLPPKGFASYGFAPNIHRKHLEESVRFTVPLAQGEKERMEDPVSQSLRDDMLNVCRAQLARCRGVIKEGWQLLRYLGQYILGRIDW